MTQSDSRSIIQMKARVARQDFDARAMSPSKALRLALAKCADQLYDVALSVTTVEQFTVTSANLPKRLGDVGLFVLLDGAHGQRGAIKLDTQFAAALVETQIIGEVRKSEAREREYTRTDAAMAAPFLDAVMQEFDDKLIAEFEGYMPLAMRFGDRVEDVRLLGMALEGVKLDLYEITVDLEEGAKTGVITFLLPKHAAIAQPEDGAKDAQGDDTKTLYKNTMNATATLDAVVARIDMPLKDICALKPSMVLPLPVESLFETELYAPKKHLVAEVRLGQMNGFRAVRFVDQNEDISEQAQAQVQVQEDVPPAQVHPTNIGTPTAIDGTIEGTINSTPPDPVSDLDLATTALNEVGDR